MTSNRPGSRDDLTTYGLKTRRDIPQLIIDDMLHRCKVQYAAALNDRQLRELQRRAEERGPYAPSIKGFPPPPQENPELFIQSDLYRHRRYEFYPLVKHDFTIPGMGEPGHHCCVVDNDRISEFTSDYKKIKIKRLVCRRVECPKCYRIWIKTRAFEITLALEIAAFFRGERPFSLVFSIPPKDLYFKAWSWERVNHSLFNRGYRRGAKCGVDGGFVFFHPFRVRKAVKKKLRKYRKHLEGRERRLSEGDVGFWRMIRKNVLEYDDFYKYVKVGPHLHGVCFGDPTAHTGDDYFIGIQEDEENRGNPMRLKTARDVVGKVMYVLTHCGVSTLQKTVQPTRRYGCMYDFHVEPPKHSKGEKHFRIIKTPEGWEWALWTPSWVDWFTREWVPEKCREIAAYIDMAWSDDEGLGFKTNDNTDSVWLPIWKILHFRRDLESRFDLPEEIIGFFYDVYAYLVKYGTPPPLLDLEIARSTALYWAEGYLTGIPVPPAITIVREFFGEEPEEIINEANPDQEDPDIWDREQDAVEAAIVVKGLEDTPKIKKWRLMKALTDPDPEVRLAALARIREGGRSRGGKGVKS